MARRRNLRIAGLGDSELMGRLGSAAHAAGLKSVEELADLIVDSGVSARPPVDPFTERFTLEDLGERLHTVAATTDRSLRKQWFADLAPAQKIAVITVLRHKQYTALTISNDLGVPEMEVEETYAKYVTKLGSQALGVRLDTLVGRLVAAKDRAQEMAAEKGDAKAIWTIEKDFVAMMQSLGVVKRAAHRVEMVNKAEETKAAALERLVKLAEQRATRNGELRQLEAEEFDVLPAVVETEYQELRES